MASMTAAAYLLARRRRLPAQVINAVIDCGSYLALRRRSRAAPATVPVAASLLGAIQARFLATPALVAAVPGGLETGIPPGKTPLPWAVITHVGDAERGNATGPKGATLWECRYQVAVTCPSDRKSEDTCYGALELFYAAFNYKRTDSLAWATGYARRCRILNAHLSPYTELTKENVLVRQVIFTIACTSVRNF